MIYLKNFIDHVDKVMTKTLILVLVFTMLIPTGLTGVIDFDDIISFANGGYGGGGGLSQLYGTGTMSTYNDNGTVVYGIVQELGWAISIATMKNAVETTSHNLLSDINDYPGVGTNIMYGAPEDSVESTIYILCKQDNVGQIVQTPRDQNGNSNVGGAQYNIAVAKYENQDLQRYPSKTIYTLPLYNVFWMGDHGGSTGAPLSPIGSLNPQSLETFLDNTVCIPEAGKGAIYTEELYNALKTNPSLTINSAEIQSIMSAAVNNRSTIETNFAYYLGTDNSDKFDPIGKLKKAFAFLSAAGKSTLEKDHPDELNRLCKASYLDFLIQLYAFVLPSDQSERIEITNRIASILDDSVMDENKQFFIAISPVVAYRLGSLQINGESFTRHCYLVAKTIDIIQYNSQLLEVNRLDSEAGRKQLADSPDHESTRFSFYSLIKRATETDYTYQPNKPRAINTNGNTGIRIMYIPTSNPVSHHFPGMYLQTYFEALDNTGYFYMTSPSSFGYLDNPSVNRPHETIWLNTDVSGAGISGESIPSTSNKTYLYGFGALAYFHTDVIGPTKPPFGKLEATPDDEVISEAKIVWDRTKQKVVSGNEYFGEYMTVKLYASTVMANSPYTQYLTTDENNNGVSWEEALKMMDENQNIDITVSLDWTGRTDGIDGKPDKLSVNIANPSDSNKWGFKTYDYGISGMYEPTDTDLMKYLRFEPEGELEANPGEDITTKHIHLTYQGFKQALESNSVLASWQISCADIPLMELLQKYGMIADNGTDEEITKEIVLRATFAANLKVEIHNKAEVNGTKIKEEDLNPILYPEESWQTNNLTDDASYIFKIKSIGSKITPVVPERRHYYSTPEAYAELKNYGYGSNQTGTLSEEYEVMSGVPTNRQLYYSAGGSEFIVDVSFEYIYNKTAIRSYTAFMEGTKCEFYDSDTFPALVAKDGEDHLDKTSSATHSKVGHYSYYGYTPEGASSSQTSLTLHTDEDTITAQWTGTITNNSTITCTRQYKNSVHNSDSWSTCSQGDNLTPTCSITEGQLATYKITTSWDVSAYNTALSQAVAWAKKYENTNSTYTAQSIASTDEKIRQWKIGNAIIEIQTVDGSNGLNPKTEGEVGSLLNITINSSQESTGKLESTSECLGSGYTWYEGKLSTWTVSPGSCYYQPYIPPSGSGDDYDPGQPEIHSHSTGSCSENPGASDQTEKSSNIQYTITVTFDNGTLHRHELCGPCCTHYLPAIYDTWSQSFTYDTMEITDIHIWRIDQAAVSGLAEVIGPAVDNDVEYTNGVVADTYGPYGVASVEPQNLADGTVGACIKSGIPNFFYNIAMKNSNYLVGNRVVGQDPNNGNITYHTQDGIGKATEDSLVGRIRYSLDTEQHDEVYYYLGVRTDNCDGMAHTFATNNTQSGGHGHDEDWAKDGFLYNELKGLPSENGMAINGANIIESKTKSNGWGNAGVPIGGIRVNSEYTSENMSETQTAIWIPQESGPQDPSTRSGCEGRQDANNYWKTSAVFDGATELEGPVDNKYTGQTLYPLDYDGYDYDSEGNQIGEDKDYLDDNTDDLDKATDEYKKFRDCRDQTNKPYVISDILILQTSSGNQCAMYYQYDSLEMQSPEQIPRVGTDEDFGSDLPREKIFWHNNRNSCSWWDHDHINVGGYSGIYTATNSSGTYGPNDGAHYDKYKGTGDYSTHYQTYFDSDPAKTIYRPKEPTQRLMIYSLPLNIITELPNDDYLNNVKKTESEVFFVNQLHWSDITARSYRFTPNPYLTEVEEKYSTTVNKKDTDFDFSAYTKRHNYKDMWAQNDKDTDHAYTGYIINTNYYKNGKYEKDGNRANIFEVNPLIIFDPISSEKVSLVTLPYGRTDANGNQIEEDRDWRYSKTVDPNLAIDILNKELVCPRVASECEYAVLNCKYAQNIILGAWNFSSATSQVASNILDTPTLTTLNTAASNYSISGGVLNGGSGANQRIPISMIEDWGLSYQKSLEIEVKFQFNYTSVPRPRLEELMSFAKVSLYVGDQGEVGFIAQDGKYRASDKNTITSGKYIKGVFSFSKLEGCKVYVGNSTNGPWTEVDLKYKNYTGEKRFSSVDIGTEFYIGAMVGDTNGIRNSIDNLTITKPSGSMSHTEECYAITELHPSGLNVHVHTPECLTTNGAHGYNYYKQKYDAGQLTVEQLKEIFGEDAFNALFTEATYYWNYTDTYSTDHLGDGAVADLKPKISNVTNCVIYTYSDVLTQYNKAAGASFVIDCGTGLNTNEVDQFEFDIKNNTSANTAKIYWSNNTTFTEEKSATVPMLNTTIDEQTVVINLKDKENWVGTTARYIKVVIPGDDSVNYGQSITYTGFRIRYVHNPGVITYNATGDVQEYTAPYTGYYHITASGAQGGSSNGGKGGYVSGIIELKRNDKIYVYVGKQGTKATAIGTGGGYNGGGHAGTDGYGGGGMTFWSTRQNGAAISTVTKVGEAKLEGVGTTSYTLKPNGSGEYYLGPYKVVSSGFQMVTISTTNAHMHTFVLKKNGTKVWESKNIHNGRGGYGEVSEMAELEAGDYDLYVTSGCGNFTQPITATYSSDGVLNTGYERSGQWNKTGAFMVAGGGGGASTNASFTYLTEVTAEKAPGTIAQGSFSSNTPYCWYMPTEGCGIEGQYAYTASPTTTPTTHQNCGWIRVPNYDYYVSGGNTGSATASSSSGDLVTGQVVDYNYTGNVQSVTLGKGTYLLETWGAAGGDARELNVDTIRANSGGAGGYSYGVLTVNSPTVYYIYVGGRGEDAGSSRLSFGAGGWNGGAPGGTELSGEGHPENGAGGGGMTHITTSSNDNLESLQTIKSSTTSTLKYAKGTTVGEYTYKGEQQEITLLKGKYTIEVYGAQGGGASGGLGGKSVGTIEITSNNTKLYIYVGGQNGYNGGGSGYAPGGGASDVRMGGTALSNRIIVAGGGGGEADGTSHAAGGAGGGTSGSAGKKSYGYGGSGGTQESGGSGGAAYNSSVMAGTAGSLGQGGNGGDSGVTPGGGGGGGYYGGGGGGEDINSSTDGGGGGGGGSGYVSNNFISSTVSMESGVQSGNGYIKITAAEDIKEEKTTYSANNTEKDYSFNDSSLVIAAGGGGGAGSHFEAGGGASYNTSCTGGAGGGGTTNASGVSGYTSGGSNTTGYKKGLGKYGYSEASSNNAGSYGGGGGGYYGGTWSAGPSNSIAYGGGGGSGYIKSTLTSIGGGAGVNTSSYGYGGNGHARITALTVGGAVTGVNLGIGDTLTVNCIGESQAITLKPGKYRMEAWGASGYGGHAGEGGYTAGTVDIATETTVYVYVGEKGKPSTGNTAASAKPAPATYNGGGDGGSRMPTKVNSGNHMGGSGGGASDIRLESGAWNDTTSLQSRILVAGGGGGSGCASNHNGGHGGGLIGVTTLNPAGDYAGASASGGGQNAPGASVGSYKGSDRVANNGDFGKGSDAVQCGAGGGGGYYGGGSEYTAGGGGGSSFVTGYTGCDTTYRSKHQNLNFTDVVMQQGGNTGDGKVIITCISLYTDVTYTIDAQNGGYAGGVSGQETIAKNIPARPGTQTSGFMQGVGASSEITKGVGGGGAGWYGGKTERGAGAGGSSWYDSNKIKSAEYYGLGGTKTLANTEDSRTGDGVATIEFLTPKLGEFPSLNEIIAVAALIPDDSPIWSCDRTPNNHICDYRCKTEKILECSEPHHAGNHYDGDELCYDACMDDEKHKIKKPTDVSDGTFDAGNFINLDWSFQIYYANTGDFYASNNYGIGTLIQHLGRGYTDNMDVARQAKGTRTYPGCTNYPAGDLGNKYGPTQINQGWTRAKYIKLPVNVLYKGKLYLKGETIELANKGEYRGLDGSPYDERNWTNYGEDIYDDIWGNSLNGDSDITYRYQFYCVESNNEIAGGLTEVASVAINDEHYGSGNDIKYIIDSGEASGYKDNITNRTRYSNYTAHHTTYNKFYFDVVGRIGSLIMLDTGDFRFSNLFKRASGTNGSGALGDPIYYTTSDGLSTYNGSYIDDPTNINGAEVKVEDNRTWVRVLYQNIRNNTNYFTTDEAAQGHCEPSDGKFMILDQLEQFRDTDGKFTLMLDYPNQLQYGSLKNVWRQSTNPWSEQRTNGYGSGKRGVDVDGFEDLGYTMTSSGYDKGLEYNGSRCVLDGSMWFGNWWLCVGIIDHSYSSTNGDDGAYTMPGPIGPYGSRGAAECELWVAVPDYMLDELGGKVICPDAGTGAQVNNVQLQPGNYRIYIQGTNINKAIISISSNYGWSAINDPTIASGLSMIEEDTDYTDEHFYTVSGPGTRLSSGKYNIKLTGEHLDQLTWTLKDGTTVINNRITNKQLGPNQLSITFNTNTTIGQLELIGTNKSTAAGAHGTKETVVLNSFEVLQQNQALDNELVGTSAVTTLADGSTLKELGLSLSDTTMLNIRVISAGEYLEVSSIAILKLVGSANNDYFVEGIVKEVDQSKQRAYLVGHVDVRGVSPLRGYGVDVYHTHSEDGQLRPPTTVGYDPYDHKDTAAFPLDPLDNNIGILQEEPMLVGYDSFLSINTMGNYYGNHSGYLQVIPEYYVFDKKTEEMKPVDVYIQIDNNYLPINIWGLITGEDAYTWYPEDTTKHSDYSLSKIYNYKLTMEFGKEYERRIVSNAEREHTDILRTAIVMNNEQLKTPSYVNKYTLGNAQFLQLDGGARTFVGGETSAVKSGHEINGVQVGDYQGWAPFYSGYNSMPISTSIIADVLMNRSQGSMARDPSTRESNTEAYTNPSGRIYNTQWWLYGQRWHFTIGLPSSAVFVDAGKEPTIENVNKYKTDQYLIMSVIDVRVIGEIWNLRYYRGYQTLKYSYDGTEKDWEIPYWLNINGDKHYVAKTILVYQTVDKSPADIDIIATH